MLTVSGRLSGPVVVSQTGAVLAFNQLKPLNDDLIDIRRWPDCCFQSTSCSTVALS